jgi:hypothetical protein
MARTRTSLSRIPALAVFTLCSLAAVIGLVGGCSSSLKEPNEKNFMAALNAYYSTRDECLFPDTLRFPYETARSDQSPRGTKGMDALTASDLMKREEGKLVGVNRYILTPAGERAGGRFCYGHREITAVPSFTPPETVGSMPATTVTYRYVMRDLPMWAKTDQMRAAFPELAQSTSADPQATAKLVLTANGWKLAADTIGAH